MTINDLQYIFQPQIELCYPTDAKVWYMLQDGDHTVIERHPADDLGGLLLMLDNFRYAGTRNNVPRFVK